MRKSLAFLASLTLVLTAAGCGGSGLSSLVPNTLTGSYTGTGSASTTSDLFQANISIGSDGTLSGTITDETNHAVATVGGTLSLIGILSGGTISVVNSTGVSQGSGSLSGSFSEVNSSENVVQTISSTLTASISGQTEVFTFPSLQSTTPALKQR